MTYAGLPAAGKIKLVCSIGNPGDKYANTRHNAGVWLQDQLVQRHEVSLVATAKLPVFTGKSIDGMRYAKTTTYMNESGQAVVPLAKYFEIEPASVLILHDELDLEPGIAKFKFGGRHGGHNGLRDIINHFGTQDFWRFRIGIGKPIHEQDASDWVLAKPTTEQRSQIDRAIETVLANWHHVVNGDMDASMRAVHS